MTIWSFADSEELAGAAAGMTLGALRSGIASRGFASLVVSGGRTPVATFRRIAAAPPVLGWEKVRIWFADERAVPPDDPESNYRLASEALIEPAGIPAASVHRMPADASDLERAAALYEREFPERADLILLGIGEDGHLASLFPHAALLHETARRIAVVRDSPKPPPLRMTITPRVLAEARAVLVLATGPDKAAAVARALAEAGDVEVTPARLVRDRDWLIDSDAGVGLERR